MNHLLFKNPPNAYRPAPFWSMNDRLEASELQRQVREFARVGYGGWFFHARVGIDTPYLSPEWMDAFDTALEEGRKHDQLCWIYDEDSYPSGFAGGLVLRQHPEFRARNLKMFVDEAPDEALVLARFALREQNGLLCSSRSLADDETPGTDEKLAVFAVVLFPENGWYNDGAYVDLLNPRAVDAFLQITHQKYADRFAEEFGKAIPGVFTDEPHVSPFAGPRAVTWTDDFEADFQEQHGYSLLENLPALFYEGGKSGRIRTDYWVTLSRRFQHACLQRMRDWCEKNALVLTGHCWEHGFPATHCSGGINYTQIPMQWPGVDLLGGNADKGRRAGRRQPQVGMVSLVKGVSGLAHQFGQPRIMSETYGGAGWETTFRDLKEILDWECVLGVNYIVPHLAHYSLRGCRKRDYPPAFLDYASWWPELRLINDYSGRLCYALSNGAPKVKIAVLQPLATAWEAFSSVDGKLKTEALERMALLYEGLLKELAGAQWEFDLVDEMTLAEHGSATDGKLLVGQASYSVLILPPAHTLYSGAVDVVEEFCQNGGRLLAVAPGPRSTDGGDDTQRIRNLLQAKTCQWLSLERAALTQALKSTVSRSLVAECADGTDPLPIYVQTRTLDEGGEMLFWVNTAKQGGRVTFRYPGTTGVQAWNLLDGSIEEIAATVENGETCWRTSVAPGQSQLLRFDRKAGPASLATPANSATCEVTLKLSDEWRFRLGNPNIFLVDKVDYRIGDGGWSPRKDVLTVLRELREGFGMKNEMELRGNRAARFYDIWKEPRQFGTVQLRADVDVAVDPASLGAVELVLESGRRFDIAVNGTPVAASGETWISGCFDRFPMGNCLNLGKNELVLTTEFAEDSELEPFYLIGDFGVWRQGAARFEIGNLPTRLVAGSWLEQGLPFFSGRLRISQTVSVPRGTGDWQLVSPGLAMPLATVYANGRVAGSLLWPPYAVNLPVSNERKQFELELECITGMKNTLGPWHWDSCWEQDTLFGSHTWMRDNDGWQGGYHLHHEGIPEGIRLERVRQPQEARC
jgi:hypothetical protein